MLNCISFRHAVISFPTKSASGRERGMEAFYTEMFTNRLPGGMLVVDRVVFDNEMFFIVERGGPT
jgi:16S rRNA (guanine(1405)-N(7))-methyltransferase